MSVFSIIIPTLNEEKYIGNLLSDLSHQSYTDFEVIVVDGRSEDQTQKIVKKFTGKIPRLKIITATKRHVCHQRNLGATRAKSDWLIFMDADNRLPSYFLQGIKYKIELHQPLVFSTYFEPDSQNKKDATIAAIINYYLDNIKTTNNPGGLEAFLGFNRQTFTLLGGFNEKVHFAEGAELLKRASKKGIVMTIFKDPKYTYSFRRFRTQGTLNLARNMAQYEFNRLLNLDSHNQKASKLYPMLGGSFFSQKKESPTTIERMLSDLSKVKSLPQETKKLIKAKTHFPDSLRPLLNLIDPSTKNDSS
jgi:glycosyltransferase involved in cell wall biosynthesis